MGRLRKQAKSQMYLRTVLGAFFPASILTLSNETDASAADPAWATAGVHGPRDEFKAIANGADGDFSQATAIWAIIHPDLTVYTQSGSEWLTKSVLFPATEEAYSWMAKNEGFVEKYKDVAAFFIPQQQAGDPFSMDAYRTRWTRIGRNLRSGAAAQDARASSSTVCGSRQRRARTNRWRTGTKRIWRRRRLLVIRRWRLDGELTGQRGQGGESVVLNGG